MAQLHLHAGADRPVSGDPVFRISIPVICQVEFKIWIFSTQASGSSSWEEWSELWSFFYSGLKRTPDEKLSRQ